MRNGGRPDGRGGTFINTADMASPACCPPNSTGYLATDDSAARAGTCLVLADGTEVYLVAPPATAAADAGASAARGVLLVPDIFGWNGGRTRALADHLAATQGFWVAVPKILQPSLSGGTDGDGVPANFERSQLDAYLRNLTWEDVLRPRVLAAVRALIDRGRVASIGLLGFCWGGCPVAHALADAELFAELPLRCGAIAHPSLSLEQRVFGRDPAALLARARAPLLLLPAKNDPAEYRAGGAWLDALQGAQPASRCVEFNDMTHGWVPRGDLGDAAVARDVQRAIDEIVAFFSAHCL